MKAFLLIATLVLSSALTSLIQAADKVLEKDECKRHGADEPDLNKVLQDARNGLMKVHWTKLSEINVESITDTSSDHCLSDTKDRMISGIRNVRAACPW